MGGGQGGHNLGGGPNFGGNNLTPQYMANPASVTQNAGFSNQMMVNDDPAYNRNRNQGYSNQLSTNYPRQGGGAFQGMQDNGA